MSDFFIKVGDRFPVLVTTLKNADGSAMDLTGTKVKFFMRWPDRPDTPIIGGDGSLVDNPTGGKVKYEWKPGDTNRGGLYQGEWRVDYSDGRQTVPNNGFMEIRVMENIDIPEVAAAASAQDESDATVVPA
jgi:hypothetical protein